MNSDTAVEALAALAQEHRLAVFRMLVQAGKDGLPAGALADALGVPNSSLSFHLAHLSRAGLVTQQRQHRSIIYRADYAAMNALLLPGRQVFLVDTHVNPDPTAEQLTEITLMAAAAVRRFGIEPKAALLSHSNFGTGDTPSALKMRRVRELLEMRAPDFEFDGEMHGDCALNETLRKAALPETTLTGSANLLVLPNLDSANIAYNLLKTGAGNNVAIGPILLGCAAPVNILTASATVRRIVNMTALTVASANAQREESKRQ